MLEFLADWILAEVIGAFAGVAILVIAGIVFDSEDVPENADLDGVN